MPKTSLTIIDNKNLRGVLGPSKVLSKKLLEDIIDFIELSNVEIAKETETRIKEADRKKSWISLARVRSVAKKAK